MFDFHACFFVLKVWRGREAGPRGAGSHLQPGQFHPGKDRISGRFIPGI